MNTLQLREEMEMNTKPRLWTQADVSNYAIANGIAMSRPRICTLVAVGHGPEPAAIVSGRPVFDPEVAKAWLEDFKVRRRRAREEDMLDQAS